MSETLRVDSIQKNLAESQETHVLVELLPMQPLGPVVETPENVVGLSVMPPIPSDLTVSDDPAEWVIDSATVEYLISKDHINQNLDADLSVTKTFVPSQNAYRSCSKAMFQRRLKNGEWQNRKYLIYSPSKKALFCMPCRLFGGRSALATEGYSDWNNAHQILSRHDNSPEHFACEKALFKRCRTENRIDNQLCHQIRNEIDYWKNVLRRVVAVIQKLSSRGLAFRGSDEKFGSVHNGNYMMCLELIAEFDPFLAKHIKDHGNPGSGKTSYLSSSICNEFLTLMAKKVVHEMVNELKENKYFSLVVDSTPDVGHVDQLSIILRYVARDGSPVERFFKFLPRVGHKAKDLKEAVDSFLAEYGIDIKDCVGQSYDNASNMSGTYNGLQKLIETMNYMATYVPCAGHSLNLVLSWAADCCLESVKFF